MFAFVALVALVVDGGNLWAQQRIVQNGADASSEAGAIVLAERLAGSTLTGYASWDAKVRSRIDAVAAANGLTAPKAYYTDICGIPLKPDGTAALLGGKEVLADAAEVGDGVLPAGTTTPTPDCPASQVGPVAGVLVLGHKPVKTYFAGVAGLPTVDVGNRATAVAGFLQGCGASEDNACTILPITIPVNISMCDGQNKVITSGGPWLRGQIYRFPICGNSEGNVGYLDWEAPRGGAGDVVCSILYPDNPPIDLPEWVFAPESGNTNGGGGHDCDVNMTIEEALRTRDGES